MSVRTIIALTGPGVAIIGAAAVALLAGSDSTFLTAALHGYPYVALVAALLLAWRMESARAFVAAATLGALQIAFQPQLLASNALAAALVAAFVAPGIALLSFVPDRGFNGKRLFESAALAVGPFIFFAFFSAGRTEHAAQLYMQIAWPAAVLAMAIVIVAAVRSRRAPEAGLAWLTLAVVLGVNAPAGSTARTIWLLAGTLVLIAALVENASAMAFRDELTGLPSRRALKHATAALRAPYAIAIVDVDHFKSFNDEHGHDVGDQVLRMVAAKLQRVGGGGTAYRSGGEEFTIVFPGVSKRDAVAHVEAVREAVATSEFALRKLTRRNDKNAKSARGSGKKGQILPVTVSVGVAGSSKNDHTVDDIVRAADKAMYRAKEGGRNQVVV